MSPDKPHFRLSTSGDSGQSHHDIPRDSDMVEFFECTETQTKLLHECIFIAETSHTHLLNATVQTNRKLT